MLKVTAEVYSTYPQKQSFKNQNGKGGSTKSIFYKMMHKDVQLCTGKTSLEDFCPDTPIWAEARWHEIPVGCIMLDHYCLWGWVKQIYRNTTLCVHQRTSSGCYPRSPPALATKWMAEFLTSQLCKAEHFLSENCKARALAEEHACARGSSMCSSRGSCKALVGPWGPNRWAPYPTAQTALCSSSTLCYGGFHPELSPPFLLPLWHQYLSVCLSSNDCGPQNIY